MKLCAVVSEFNPFHNGHKFFLSEVKSKGFDAVVCIMSGNFVQRAEYAVCDKKIRAEIASQCGADLVLSLPFPWSSAGAELFARGAISIANSLGCIEAVAFGSECGDISLLSKCADCLSETSFDEIKSLQKVTPKLSYAQARHRLILQKAGEKCADILMRPNDILGVEYLKAIKYLKSDISAITIKRMYANHNSEGFFENICSSSYIRERMYAGEIDDILRFVPWENKGDKNCFFKVDETLYFNLLRGSILSREPSEISDFCEICGGFEYAAYREALIAENFNAFFESLKARHITDSKIRRALLFVATGVKKGIFNELPAYTEVLAYNDVGRKILSLFGKSFDIAVISKTANIKSASELAKNQFKIQRRAEMIFKTILQKL